MRHHHRLLAVALAAGLPLLVAGCERGGGDAGGGEEAAPATRSAAGAPGQAAGAQVLRLDDKAAMAVVGEETRAFLATQPLLASFNDLPETEAGGPYNARITDYSPEGFAHVRAVAAAAADRLSRIARDGLDERTRTNLDVIERVFRYYAGAPGIDYGLIDSYFGHVPYVVSQISGPHLDIPKLMQSQQRVASRRDAEDYIARLAGFRDAFAGIIRKIEADADAGVIPPRVLVEHTLIPIRNFIADPPRRNPLYLALARKLAAIGELSPAERAALLDDAQEALRNAVYPAYGDLLATLTSLLPRAPRADGIWAQPKGREFYLFAVKMLGDTDLTPDRIHQIGLEEVERITGEMDATLKRLGYTEGSVGERMAKLGEDPSQLFPDSEEGREAILAYLRHLVDEVNAKIPDWFATIPTQKLEIRRIPVFSEAGEAGGFYTNPSLDGTRPGIYWINLRDMTAWPKWSLKTLTYHEAVPGHHFQISIQMSQGELPLMRRLAPFNAYTEGWALYAERLAAEMGMYENDPLGDLGRLQDELFRAVRLVVDTGLHWKKWTREQAIDYMLRTTGSARSEVVAEIERYMAWPGQALGYKLGQLKILELREKARQALGERFDIKAFHDVVLKAGAVPMSVLEQRVDAWIRTEQAKTGR
ncbi:MAG: hypothetical protein KatS3mg119_1417 [Rhodothalassiaceae bacterium]|nr:MAG: hypothetical protein KatS3mg119_1417 [Rhodothalassiaceae bacterium]